MEEVAPNHIRFNNHGGTEPPVTSIFQSILPLYPHPIGSCRVAYFELEVLSLNSNSSKELSIGLALDRFGGRPGCERNSYGYASNGGILLSFAIPRYVLKEPSYGMGDIVGCGINFQKRSVFFTKNGVVVSERTRDVFEKELLNLEALHAVVGCESSIAEWKINFGATPFVFNILKYQQLGRFVEAKQSYYEILLPHLLCYSDEETYEALKNNRALPMVSDGNLLPDSCTDLSAIQRLILHPFKSKFNPMFRIGVIVRTAYPMLNQLKNDPYINAFLNGLINTIVPTNSLPLEDMSTEEKLEALFTITHDGYSDRLLRYIGQSVSELTKAVFQTEKNVWAVHLLALHALFEYPNVPINQFWKQILIDQLFVAFDVEERFRTPPFNEEDLQVLLSVFYYTSYSQVQKVTLRQVIERKNALKAGSRRKYLEEAKSIFKSAAFDADVEKFLGSIPMPDTTSKFSREVRLAMALKYHNKNLTNPVLKMDAIVYGLYVLNFDPIYFNSSTAESDFYIEVDRGLESIVTNEAISQYLTEFLEDVKKMDESAMTEEYFESVIDPIFNFKYTGDNVKQKLIEFLEGKINELKETNDTQMQL